VSLPSYFSSKCFALSILFQYLCWHGQEQGTEMHEIGASLDQRLRGNLADFPLSEGPLVAALPDNGPVPGDP